MEGDEMRMVYDGSWCWKLLWYTIVILISLPALLLLLDDTYKLTRALSDPAKVWVRQKREKRARGAKRKMEERREEERGQTRRDWVGREGREGSWSSINGQARTADIQDKQHSHIYIMLYLHTEIVDSLPTYSPFISFNYDSTLFLDLPSSKVWIACRHTFFSVTILICIFLGQRALVESKAKSSRRCRWRKPLLSLSTFVQTDSAPTRTRTRTRTTLRILRLLGPLTYVVLSLAVCTFNLIVILYTSLAGWVEKGEKVRDVGWLWAIIVKHCARRPMDSRDVELTVGCGCIWSVQC